MVEAEEECDDGNVLPGDGCSDICLVEGWPPCTPDNAWCFVTIVCGNGVLEAGETCDDGNVTSADGCSSACEVEPGWACPMPGQPCVRVPPDACGNGVVEAEYGEQCDDGANDGGYGKCQPGCVLGGYCGDGIVDPTAGEECDDGVNDGGYGECAPGCLTGPYCGDGIVQPDYEECELSPSPEWGGYGECALGCVMGPHCGDGIVQDPHESCDDGNNVDNDGCSAACMDEPSLGP